MIAVSCFHLTTISDSLLDAGPQPFPTELPALRYSFAAASTYMSTLNAPPIATPLSVAQSAVIQQPPVYRTCVPPFISATLLARWSAPLFSLKTLDPHGLFCQSKPGPSCAPSAPILINSFFDVTLGRRNGKRARRGLMKASREDDRFIDPNADGGHWLVPALPAPRPVPLPVGGPDCVGRPQTCRIETQRRLLPSTRRHFPASSWRPLPAMPHRRARTSRSRLRLSRPLSVLTCTPSPVACQLPPAAGRPFLAAFCPLLAGCSLRAAAHGLLVTDRARVVGDPSPAACDSMLPRHAIATRRLRARHHLPVAGRFPPPPAARAPLPLMRTPASRRSPLPACSSLPPARGSLSLSPRRSPPPSSHQSPPAILSPAAARAGIGLNWYVFQSVRCCTVLVILPAAMSVVRAATLIMKL
ncbi:hypothetical protein GGX14DRAFT_580951 [Mycena pura]|uniref:Uncharacterized protein n=1 Tax=Mycena pura TaxID=153505 RepID=A0AAD6XVD5_9AGAR|nr:hypothetical protein GGX14DRAFT_580951 [Mycena pura]